MIAGIPAIAGVLYFYKTGVSDLSGALLAAGSILGLIFCTPPPAIEQSFTPNWV